MPTQEELMAMVRGEYGPEADAQAQANLDRFRHDIRGGIREGWIGEYDAASRYLNAARSRETPAQAQLRMGGRAAQMGMVGQAGANGNNPALMRAAATQGSVVAGDTHRASRTLQAAETQAAQQIMGEAMARRGQYMTEGERLALGSYGADMSAAAGEEQRAAAEEAARFARNQQIAGAAIGAAGSMFAMSDVDLKTYARDMEVARLSGQLDSEGARTDAQLGGYRQQRFADAEAARVGSSLDRENARTEDELLRSMRGFAYEYKPEAQASLGVPGGRQYGPIAQELEESRLGAQMVIDTPGGKAIDHDGAIRGMLGAAGRLSERDEEVDELSRMRDELLMRRLEEIERGRR